MFDATTFGDLEGRNILIRFASAVTPRSFGGTCCAGFSGGLETLRRDLSFDGGGLFLWYANLPLYKETKREKN